MMTPVGPRCSRAFFFAPAQATAAAQFLIFRRMQMGLIPVMLSVWGASLVLMLGVSIYVARVGRNEEAQIFLADSSSNEKSEQEQIAARVSKLLPLKRSVMILAGATTLLVVVYFVFNALHQF
jgi:hypothetical protein